MIGTGLMGGGVLLRLWAVGHAGRGVTSTALHAVRLATSGPYAYVRHPVHVAHFLIACGFVVLAENWPGIIVLAAALGVLYRIVIRTFLLAGVESRVRAGARGGRARRVAEMSENSCLARLIEH